jgi:hypothetical protein
LEPHTSNTGVVYNCGLEVAETRVPNKEGIFEGYMVSIVVVQCVFECGTCVLRSHLACEAYHLTSSLVIWESEKEYLNSDK